MPVRGPLTTQLSPGAAVSMADLGPDLDYADWRSEVLNLTTGSDPTYFGWPQTHGLQRLAVLRGGVLSPLAESDTIHEVGRAMLADALHAAGTVDLEDWAEKLADEFVDEVIGPEGHTGFEIRMRTVAAWVLGRSLAGSSW